jgi:hypothetical protein
MQPPDARPCPQPVRAVNVSPSSAGEASAYSRASRSELPGRVEAFRGAVVDRLEERHPQRDGPDRGEARRDSWQPAIPRTARLDPTTAERCVGMLFDYSTRHDLPTWRALRLCHQGALLVERGRYLRRVKDVARRLRRSWRGGML